MTRSIAVAEHAGISGAEDLDMRNDRFVALVDDAGHCRSRRGFDAAFPVQADDGIRCGMSVAIVDIDDELAGLLLDGAGKHHRYDDKKRAHRPPVLSRRAAV